MLLLVVAGLGLGAVPGMPRLILNPNLVLGGMLPLLILTCAVTIPWRRYRRAFGAISSQSVGLVFFTTACGAACVSCAPRLVVRGGIDPADRQPIPRKLVIMLKGRAPR